MKKPFLMALAALVIVFGLGFVANVVLFRNTSSSVGAADHQARPPSRERAEKPAAAPGVENRSFRVVDVRGRVLRRNGREELRQIQPGEELPFGERLEAEDGQATLAGLTSTVELFPRSVVMFSSERNILLDVGRIRTESTAEDPLQLHFSGSDAVAELGEGAMVAIADGAGHVTVGSEVGAIRLTANGESVELAAGEESSVAPQRSPTAPRITPTLFLRVRRPPRETRLRLTTVRGTSAPGTHVDVNGVITTVDTQGRFRTDVRLQEGPNTITVRSRNVRGHHEERTHRVTVDSTAARIESNVAW